MLDGTFYTVTGVTVAHTMGEAHGVTTRMKMRVSKACSSPCPPTYDLVHAQPQQIVRLEDTETSDQRILLRAVQSLGFSL